MSKTTPKRVARASTEESLVLHLFDLANHLMRLGERMAAEAGLTTQEWILLLHVAGDPNFPSAARRGSEGGVLASDIAQTRGVSRATVSVLLAGLLRKGLVESAADAGDARRKRLVLSASGQQLLARINPQRRSANLRLLAGLKPAERRRMLGYLRTCLATLGLGSRKEP